MKKGSKMTEEQRKKVSLGLKGRHLSKEHRNKLREISKKLGTRPPDYTNFKKGYTPFNKGAHLSQNHITSISNSLKNKEHSLEHNRKVSKALKGKPQPWFAKEKHWNWKSGITPINTLLRNNIEYRLWREAVFARDNWTCQKTGIKGGYLIAHHINNFSNFIEIRTSIENGITLSKKAHIEFHKIYGKKNNTREQLTEFLHFKLTTSDLDFGVL